MKKRKRREDSMVFPAHINHLILFPVTENQRIDPHFTFTLEC